MRSARSVVTLAVALAGVAALAGPAWAETEPANLGNGLARLLEPAPARHGLRLTMRPLAIRDDDGRVLVDVYAKDGAALADVQRAVVAAGLRVETGARDQHALEGFVALADVEAVAAAPGVATVSQVLKPQPNVGAVTSQGVRAHRADRLPPGIDGSGITVGALSDSFDVAANAPTGDPLTIHAADDIQSGDLPADGVTVVDENPSRGATDEGRAMLQLVHDVAPGARLCFATALRGELSFAQNIRALADPQGPCRADVIVDDIAYFDEPFFSRGALSDAVDDVAAQGVHYYSAAGNQGDRQTFQSPLRIVPADGATAGTNIQLSGVDPALYAGGFLDFDPGPGQDIAQDVGVDGSGILDLQWDDPVEVNGPPLGDPLLATTGELTADQPTARIPFAGTEGQHIRATVDAIPSGSTDLVLFLQGPDGGLLDEADTGSSPESIDFTLPETGTYTFVVLGFDGALGDFTFDVRPVLSSTLTDLNVLVFDANGRLVSVASDDNRVTGRPAEITGIQGGGRLQLVIAKGSTDAGAATQLRYVLFNGAQIDEYVQPLAPGIFGHPLARGATAVAAYDPFRPILPESFNTVGGDLPILFDSSGNRLPQPDVRRAPQIAAADGGNTTFFVADSVLDDDTLPNFFGTSAAAPHAAGIAALVLQASGGPGSMTPDAMRSLLEGSAFRHDLDPFHAGVTAGGLTVSADGTPGQERRDLRPRQTTPGSMNDPRFFTVSYAGPDSIVRLTLNGAGANGTGLSIASPLQRGLVFDPRPFSGLPLFGGPPLFEQGFPFTVGATRGGIAPDDVSATFSRASVGNANAEQFQRMTVTFAPGALTTGRSVSFGVDRDEAVTAAGDAEAGNSADQLGQGVLFPSGSVAGPGLSWTAVTSTGAQLSGVVANEIGAGWTPVDGFGFVNAEAAVAAAAG